MSASNAIITSPNTLFVKHFEDKIQEEEGGVKSYFGLKAPGAEDKWRMKHPYGTSDGSFKKFWSLVKQGKIDWDEDTDKIFDDASLKLLAEECGWATLRLEDCPEVSCFHLSFHYAGEGLKKRKVVKKNAKKEHTDDSTFQATGRLIGVGNKCCAVLHDCPTEQTNPTKSFVNAYGKGRGIIKKWVYSECVIRPEVIQRDDFIAAYKTTETSDSGEEEEVLGGLDAIVAEKVAQEEKESEAKTKHKAILEASKLSEEDKIFIIGGAKGVKIMKKAKAKAEEKKKVKIVVVKRKMKRKSYKTRKAGLLTMIEKFYEIEDKVVGMKQYEVIEAVADKIKKSKACVRNADKTEEIENLMNDFEVKLIQLGYDFEEEEEGEQGDESE
jgi:hypothetical protein